MTDKYFILSIKHTKADSNCNRGVCVWWAHDKRGYVWNLQEAGVYEKEDAEEVEKSTHGDNVAVRCVDAWKQINTVVYDVFINKHLEQKKQDKQAYALMAKAINGFQQ